MINLLPCPVCGHQPRLSSLEPEYHSLKYFCGVHASCGDWKDSKLLAAADWNKRVQEYQDTKRSNGMYKLFSVQVSDCGVQCDGWDEIVIAETEAEAVEIAQGRGYESVDDEAIEMHFYGFEIQIKKL